MNKFWRSPHLLLVLTTLFWGANAVVGKLLSNQIPPFTLNTLRWVVAVAILVPLARRGEGEKLRHWRSRWRPLTVMAITGVLGFNALVYLGVHYTSAINAALINSFAPVMIALLSFLFFGEGLHKRQVLGMVMAFAGVIWILSRGDLSVILSLQFNYGDLIILVAILLWSIYSLAVRRVVRYMSNLAATTISSVLGLVALVPVSLWEIKSQNPVYFGWEALAGVVYLGVFCSVLAFLWWNYGVARLGPARAAVFMYLTPLFTVLLSYIMLGEVIEAGQVTGGILVMLGVYLTSGTPAGNGRVAVIGDAAAGKGFGSPHVLVKTFLLAVKILLVRKEK
ncbi:MAG: DMT family transporter [Thermoanaerobacteraceae bacterium]|nr:DMT family transporter [Thermoanaerobacteraceae bacterium]